MYFVGVLVCLVLSYVVVVAAASILFFVRKELTLLYFSLLLESTVDGPISNEFLFALTQSPNLSLSLSCHQIFSFRTTTNEGCLLATSR